MKIKVRKITIVLLIMCFLLVVFAMFPMFKGNKTNIVYAQEITENMQNANNALSPKELVVAIENDLNSQGESIVSVLHNQRDYYENEFNTANSEEKDVILKKLNAVEKAIEDVSLYMSCLSSDNDMVTRMSTTASQYPYHVSPDCTCGSLEYIAGTPCANCIIYTDTNTAVTAIAAGFEVRGWALAADLLWFNMSNTTPNIEYWPTLGTSIAGAPQIANKLAQENVLAWFFDQDDPEFLNGVFDSEIEGDVFNSLGSFYYSKTPASDGMINVSIQDLYDWDHKDNGGSGNVLNNTMYSAQEMGILIPFYTRINLTIPGYAPFDWVYTDEGVMITGVADDITNVNIPTVIKDMRVHLEQLPDVNISSIDTNAFANQTQLTSITLPSTITSIGANAFSGCTNLTSINIPANVTSIGMGAFSGCSSLTNITIPAGVTYIGEGAFAGCSNLNISVNTSNPNYSAQGNILYNKTETKIIGSGDIAANITVSNTVTEIGASAFSGNTNLQRLDIYGTPVIDDLAFYNCTNLNEVYFYSYTVPEIGSGAFTDNEFTLYVPHSKQSAYMSEFVGYTNNITSLAINVTLMVDDEVYDTVDTYYGATIAGVTDPFKVGYIFNYWTDDNGNIYQNEGVWDSTVNLTVNANWTPRQSYINFVGFGTDSIEDKLVTYDQAIGELPVPDTTGPTFIGWKDSNGIYYSENDIWKQTNNLTLIADYEGEESGDVILYYVDLDQDGGEGGSDNVHAEYLAPMPTATAPTRIGYDFKGYYTEKNGEGTMYYDENMSSAKNWDIPRDTTLYAYWIGYTYTVTFNQNGGTGGTTSVEVTYGSDMPTSGVVAPSKIGYTFDGYYDENNKQYYIGPNLTSAQEWDKLSSTTLIAKWIVNEYTITLYWWEGRTSEITVTYGNKISIDTLFTKQHYEFIGFYSLPNGQGTCYIEGNVIENYGYYMVMPFSTNQTWTQDSNGVLYAHWEKYETSYFFDVYCIGEGDIDTRSIVLESGIKTTLTAGQISGYTFDSWEINGNNYTSENIEYTFELHRSYITGEVTIFNPNYTNSIAYSDGYISLYFEKIPEPEPEQCVAEGTLITLADGRQVPVETLTGNEMLLVWNMRTGTFDVAPILFIDHDALATYKIINLRFSDGTHVKVISEHAFFDCSLNKYVYLREDAGKFIGHWFNKQTTDANGNLIWIKVQLTSVTITQEVTTAYSPVTYNHLCLYANGMLSMPGGIDGLINIFEVDGETMQINQAKYFEDIATYGLFTYEEFYELYQVPEEMFEACGGQYLKVAIGKGLLDYERLGQLIESYSEFFV